MIKNTVHKTVIAMIVEITKAILPSIKKLFT